MKKGWLLVNGFLKTQKFEEIYTMLQKSAQKQNIALTLTRGSELIFPIGTRIELPDFVLFWDKDISLARRIESMGVPVFNSASGVQVCDDKILTAEKLTENGVPTPKTIVAPKTFDGVPFDDYTFLDKGIEMLGLPLVIKEAHGSFGAQVYLAEDRESAVEIIKRIGAKPFILQEFIKESKGKDIRVNVVGDTIICAMLRKNEKDFRSNITGGGVAEKVTLSKEQEELALSACKAVGVDFGGVDILFGKEGALVCEVNSNPHFKSTLDCTGIDLSEHIINYIKAKI